MLIVTESFQYYKNGAVCKQLTDAEVGVGANLWIVWKDTVLSETKTSALALHNDAASQKRKVQTRHDLYFSVTVALSSAGGLSSYDESFPVIRIHSGQ
jgi:hypothetical protein